MVGDEHGAGWVDGQLPSNLRDEEVEEGSGAREPEQRRMHERGRTSVACAAVVEGRRLVGEEEVRAHQRHELVVHRKCAPFEEHREAVQHSVSGPTGNCNAIAGAPLESSVPEPGEDVVGDRGRKRCGAPTRQLHVHLVGPPGQRLAVRHEQHVAVLKLAARGVEKLAHGGAAKVAVVRQVAPLQVEVVAEDGREAQPKEQGFARSPVGADDGAVYQVVQDSERPERQGAT
mmetsp:Transcript_60270/g.166818  ORF Transcript_60270/g.166818 Transcript_60270/m.166818 type:complete len:231 (-) Transcript_60270:237-929(-)